ncbi:MAG: hypothetical protein ABSA52_14585 [Candidatus Binatia bacterium]
MDCRTEIGARGRPALVPADSELGYNGEDKESGKEQCRATETPGAQNGHVIYSRYSVAG